MQHRPCSHRNGSTLPKTMPGKRVCKKPLWHRLILNGDKADISQLAVVVTDGAIKVFEAHAGWPLIELPTGYGGRISEDTTDSAHAVQWNLGRASRNNAGGHGDRSTLWAGRIFSSDPAMIDTFSCHCRVK